MKKVAVPAVLLILVVLQNSVFEHIKVFGVKPDIVITFVICYTLIFGNPRGTIVGIAGGLLEDIFFGGAFGINSLACMLTAFLIGSIESVLYKDNIFIPGLFTITGTVIKELIVFFFLYLIRMDLSFSTVFMNIVLPEAVYNSVLTIVFYRYMKAMSTKYFPEQIWRL